MAVDVETARQRWHERGSEEETGAGLPFLSRRHVDGERGKLQVRGFPGTHADHKWAVMAAAWQQDGTSRRPCLEATKEPDETFTASRKRHRGGMVPQQAAAATEPHRRAIASGAEPTF